MAFAVVKRTAQRNAARNKTERKYLEERKGAKTQNMPPCEEPRGDSPSGLAANAPFRSDSKVDLFIRVLASCLANACISQAPAKVPFEVFSDFLRLQTQ